MITKEALLTPTIINLVREVLRKKAIAQVLREEVNAIAKIALTQIEAIADDVPEIEPPFRCREWKDLWKVSNMDVCEKVYRLMDKLEKVAGIKPKDKEWDFCPALSAEWALTIAETALVDEAAKVTTLTKDALMCQPDAMNVYRGYIDLLINMVIAEVPDFTCKI